MGGRIYDPTLGRFLQADPIVQAPKNSQSYSRFAYVFNNPMTYTDPSGYSAWTKFRDKVLKPIAAIAVAYYTGQWAQGWAWISSYGAIAQGAIIGAVAGGAAGFVATGSLKGTLQGAAAGAVFGGIGGYFNGGAFEGGIAHVGSHALAGGITSDLQGGKFGHGFFSAGLTKTVNVNGIVGTEQGADWTALRVATAGAIGGTISKLTGGKFANGAVTAAFAQAFNGESSAKYKDALAELQKDVHEDANRRKDQITRLMQQEDWNEIRKLYPHLENISDNKMFLEALNLNQEFSRISKETLPGKVSYELGSKIGKPAKLAVEIYVNRSPTGVIDGLFGFFYSPELPVEHQFIYGRETVDYEYVRREYE